MKATVTVVALAATAVVLSGCTYKATTNINPATNIYSNYSDKIAGKYALHVDAEKMAGTFKVSGYACSAHKYPVDARNAFSVSVERTLENIVDELEVVSVPLDRTGLQASEFSGMILVQATDLEIDLTVIPGFWSSEMKADAEITASIQVDGPNGRLLGSSVEGEDDHTTDAGAGCSGGGIAIGKAVENAIKETLERLGERLSNAPKLR